MSGYSDSKAERFLAKGIEPVGPNVYINPNYEFTYRWWSIRLYLTFVGHYAFKNLSEYAKESAMKTVIRNLISRDMIDFRTVENKSKTVTSYWIQDTPDTAYQIKAFMKAYGFVASHHRKMELDLNLICCEVDRILDKYRDRALLDSLLMRELPMKRGKIGIVKRVNIKYLIPIREWAFNGKVKTKDGSVWFPFIFTKIVVRYTSRQMRAIAREYSSGFGKYQDEQGRHKDISFWMYPYSWRFSYDDGAAGETSGVPEEEETKMELIEEDLEEEFDEFLNEN
jgi:hypothetical protein